MREFSPFSLWLRNLRWDFISHRLDHAWRVFFHQRDLAWWKKQCAQHAASGGYVVEEMIPGMPMRLYFDSELCWLMFSEGFELAEQELIASLLQPGDTFVDVGANIGLFTLLAAKQVGPVGRVISFEPCGQTFGRLLENVRMNHLSHVSCHQAALSHEAGELMLAASTSGRDAWNSLAAETTVDSLGVHETERVQCFSWDAFAAEHDLVGRVNVMKIDVEGWELNVLRGARNTLSREDAPVLQVEFTEEAAVAAGGSCRELYRELESLGFRLYRIDKERRELVHQPIQAAFPYINLYAIKDLPSVQSRIETFRQGGAQNSTEALATR